jgi:hypothetical protein
MIVFGTFVHILKPDCVKVEYFIGLLYCLIVAMG